MCERLDEAIEVVESVEEIAAGAEDIG